MGAIALNNEVNRNAPGNRFEITADLDMSASYLADGDTLAAADVGLDVIENVIGPVGDGTNLYFWDQANLKMKAFVYATQTEVANAVDLSGVTLRVQIIGY